MKNIIKTFGLLSVFAIIPASFAATSRVSMVSKASPRLPSIAGYIMANSAANGVVNGTATSYLADPDCISNYTDCIKGNDACGSNFEDCTNSILLHAKMPNCLSVLAQCSAAGRTSLFGTADLNAIATAATTNSNGEVTAYTYPFAGSALGQMVTAAQIDNQLSADKCVKKYTSCLKRDNVCGEYFELCTGNMEFKKQALECASTLARCQSDGKTELFGSVEAANTLTPANQSRLRDMILEGAEYAANNAVNTCYRVTDQCILNACAKNPNKCLSGVDEDLIRIADAYNNGRSVSEQEVLSFNTSLGVSRGTASKYIANECATTVATNKYCYMVAKRKSVAADEKKLQALSQEEQEEIFADIFNGADGIDGRFSILQDKIVELWDDFNDKAQDKCIDTISSCVMRSCGGGIGSVCFAQSRSGAQSTSSFAKQFDSVSSDSTVHVNSGEYDTIKNSCSAVVGTDASCQYIARLAGVSDDVAANNSAVGKSLRRIPSIPTTSLTTKKSIFETLFPKYTGSEGDPIGVVGLLNSTLATSYNDAAIENMRKQCQTVALSCVKSMCGKDYENCYRNRTDITTTDFGTYSTGAATFDRSMNKVGGILDYNIVIGLCMNTVKNASICDEHLKIAAAAWRKNKDNSSWGTYDEDGNINGKYENVRAGWADANSVTTENKDKLYACAISEQNAALNDKCEAGKTMDPVDDKCIGVMDDNGCLYTEPRYQVYSEYVLESSAKTLFQQLLADVEREVQAKYNAKLTKEQNTCLAQNNGGIMGASENGSTFMWAKLNGNRKVPTNYSVKGLSADSFKASNDLYGSFCRARITVTSDDKDIQNILADQGNSTAYFAVGDAFTCGSWIDKKTLEKITKEVGEKARKDAGEGSTKEKIALAWGTIAPALAGGAIGTGLTESGVLGKWLNKADVSNGVTGNTKSNKKACADYADKAGAAAGAATDDKLVSNATLAYNYINSAISLCKDVIPSKHQSLCNVDGLEAITAENAQTQASIISGAANTIKTQCENAEDSFAPGNKAARWAVPVATTIAGGALGLGITMSVQKAKYETAENEAVAAWMEEIGEHIQCYLGSEELGSYGDVVSFTIE